MEIIAAQKTTTSDLADALTSTELEFAPGPGALGVFLASTQADSKATVTVGGRALKQDSLIDKVGTNAQIDQQADIPVVAEVRGGEKLRVDLDVITAGTIRVLAVWMGTRL